MSDERLMAASTEKASQMDQEPLKKVSPEASMAGGGFDCNICLDFAADPVVTLCGHLYCWPCIYKWLQQADSTDGFSEQQQQQCPVCKAMLSKNTLVPLYGRGQCTKTSHQSLEIPRRPSVPREAIEQHSPQLNDEQQQQQHHHHLHDSPYTNHIGEYMPPQASAFGTPRAFHSTAGGVLEGMAVAVLPLIFRNQHWTSAYYSSPYHHPRVAYYGGGSPRLRRQELEMERSLHQIWVFLFCCAILCLLLF